MSDRLKYSLNGVYRCENFAEHARQNNFPRVPIGSAGGLNGWYIKFKTRNYNNRQVAYPFVHCDDKPILLMRRFLKIIKKDGSTCFEKSGRSRYNPESGPIGFRMNIGTLLNEQNGYLDDDGALTVEYGIHVDAILGEDEVWRFNIHDKFFSSSSQNQMVELCDAWTKWYTHKQFLSNINRKEFQSHIFLILDKRPVENLLQVLHGVRIQLNNDDFNEILSIAHSLNMHNFIRYCDQQMIEYACHSPIELSSFEFLDEVVEFGLRRSLGQLVKRCETLEELVRAIKVLSIKNMPGEAMKAFAAKIFTRKF